MTGVRQGGPVSADATAVREQRLRAQGLALPTDRTPTEAVRRLAAVQSQEPGHAFWSLALRSRATTEAEVRAAYDAGEFLRTHVLRPTWHFVAAEDVRWMLATTAARVHQTNGSMLRKRGLGTAELDRGARVLADALAAGVVLARPEVVTVLADAGLPHAQLDVVLLVMHAELEQVVVSGPMRGATHTYALLDDRVPHGPADGADPTRLLRRYLAGHGPASAHDFARWSSLTLTATRTALDELHDELPASRSRGRRTTPSRRGPTPATSRPCCSCRSSTSCRWATGTWRTRPLPATRTRRTWTCGRAASSPATRTSAPGAARSRAGRSRSRSTWRRGCRTTCAPGRTRRRPGSPGSWGVTSVFGDATARDPLRSSP